MKLDNFEPTPNLTSTAGNSQIIAVTGTNQAIPLTPGTAVRLCNEGAALCRFVFGNAGASVVQTQGAGSGGSPALMPGAAEIFDVKNGQGFVALRCDGAGTTTVSIVTGEGN